MLLLLPVAVFAYCERGDTSCWPTPAEVETLSQALNPEMPRTLWWEGDPANPQTPRISGVPFLSPGDQPLYGIGNPDGVAGFKLQPVYTQESDPQTDPPCFADLSNEPRFACAAATRNNPQGADDGSKIMPGFVVFPLNGEHVKTAVQFAKDHDLCIMVAGTGHDFQNRHSCKDGLFIRTTLIKGMDFDENDSRGFGWSEGNVEVGSGTVFSELHKAAADRGLVVSSGWASTVGVAGWSMGGGHGPIANWAGLGVDNILEVEIVTADGRLVTANADNAHSDLFWALRGGGGSTFGIATKYTIRTHKLPTGGLTKFNLYVEGDFCTLKWWKNGKKARDRGLQAYLEWVQGLGVRWSGHNFLGPYEDKSWFSCGAGWYYDLIYFYYGPKEDAMAEWNDLVDSLKAAGLRDIQTEVTSMATMWENVEKDLQNIYPWTWVPEGVQSVLVTRETLEEKTLIMETLPETLELSAEKGQEEGNCVPFPFKTGMRCIYIGRLEMYHDITGNLGAAEKQTDDVAISSNFRNAMIHLVSSGWTLEQFEHYFEPLGENSYLSESAYLMNNWSNRYWGDKFPRLLAVKKKYDPTDVFWCRHCVGDDSDPTTAVLNKVLAHQPDCEAVALDD